MRVGEAKLHIHISRWTLFLRGQECCYVNLHVSSSIYIRLLGAISIIVVGKKRPVLWALLKVSVEIGPKIVNTHFRTWPNCRRFLCFYVWNQFYYEVIETGIDWFRRPAVWIWRLWHLSPVFHRVFDKNGTQKRLLVSITISHHHISIVCLYKRWPHLYITEEIMSHYGH